MIGPAVSFGSCVDAIKGNFNTLEYSLAKHISHVPTKLNGVEFTDENAESWGGVTPPPHPPLATPLPMGLIYFDTFWVGAHSRGGMPNY